VRDPIPDCTIASSMASSARRSAIAGADSGSTVRKSMVPAILVLRPSVPKRVMEWMPDSPAVSRFQLSTFPAPSGVTRPVPVTTTIGRPALSCMAAITNLLPGILRRCFGAPTLQGEADSPQKPVILGMNRSESCNFLSSCRGRVRA